MVLLIATLAAGLKAQQGRFAAVQRPEQSLGCHGQSQGSPTPHQAPIHDCCLTGHDAAIPQISSVERPPANCHQLAASAIPSSSVIAFLGPLKLSPIPSAESPGTTPLRI